jgi:hypothetical protein
MEGEPPGEPGIQLGKSHATWFSKSFQKSSSGTGTSQRARTLLKGAQRRMSEKAPYTFFAFSTHFTCSLKSSVWRIFQPLEVFTHVSR